MQTSIRNPMKKSDSAFLYEKYQRLKNLSKVIDPENEKDPKLLREIDVIEEMIEKIDDSRGSNHRSLAIKTALIYECSKVLVALKREHRAEEILRKAWDDVKSIISKPEIIFLGYKLMNHYAYLLSKKGDFARAKDVLELSKSTHETLKSNQDFVPFYNVEDLFSSFELPGLPEAKKRNEKLELIVTNNLQMLVYVYSKLELLDKYVVVLHEVLKKQLSFHETEITDWATKCVHLALCLLEKNRYKESRNHLAAATHVLCLHEKELSCTETAKNIKKYIQQNLVYCKLNKRSFIIRTLPHPATDMATLQRLL